MGTRDQERVQALQRRLPRWKPDERCKVHDWSKCSDYNERGELIQGHIVAKTDKQEREYTAEEWEQCQQNQKAKAHE